jgi:uncharacterized protein
LVELRVNGTTIGDVHMDIANTRADRRRGLLGRDSYSGAMAFPGVKSVHTIGMRFAIDVAHVDAVGHVIGVRTMKPWRLGSYVRRASFVLEAQAGAFQRWGLGVGSHVEISA